ncbi:MAG: ABC transporter ATP-binding protein [Solibacillus sp.]
MEVTISVNHVNKFYGENHIVKNLDLQVYKGEFLTLLGPSGCGKTTTLRMIAGFEQPTDGEILLNNENIADKPPYKRDVNTVFQSYALFPHMTVRENVGYGLKMKKVPKNEIAERVDEVLRLVQMENFSDRKPRQLSGGQQQRVAIGRAIINNPRVLLLDEPLGALDLKLRKQMQFELKHLQQRLGITFIYVTHDQEEALTMSDRICVMNNGNIEQIDVPHVIYNEPKTRFVADFIGETNLLEGQVVAEGQERILLLEGERVALSNFNEALVTDDVHVSIRPEHITISQQRTSDTILEGVVSEKIFVGTAHKVVVRLLSGKEIKVLTSAQVENEFEDGSNVYLSWKKERVSILAN